MSTIRSTTAGAAGRGTDAKKGDNRDRGDSSRDLAVNCWNSNGHVFRPQYTHFE
jgi:hypothetical protein